MGFCVGFFVVRGLVGMLFVSFVERPLFLSHVSICKGFKFQGLGLRICGFSAAQFRDINFRGLQGLYDKLQKHPISDTKVLLRKGVFIGLEKSLSGCSHKVSNGFAGCFGRLKHRR